MPKPLENPKIRDPLRPRSVPGAKPRFDNSVREYAKNGILYFFVNVILEARFFYNIVLDVLTLFHHVDISYIFFPIFVEYKAILFLDI